MDMAKTSALSAQLQSLSDLPYPFPSIWVNGRRVSLKHVLEHQATPESSHEASTFDFIRSWISGEEQFNSQTSGSTGAPKTITISKWQMMASALKTAETIRLPKNAHALVCLDTRYIAGKMMLARCMTLGLPMSVVDPTANPLVKIPVDECVQFTAFVPYQVNNVLESKHPHLLNNLEYVLIGGAPLSLALATQLGNFQCRFYETYGMTETVSHIALRPVNATSKQPYFQTLPGISINSDERGCLVVSADYMPDPVVTNDLVQIISPRQFIWLGRWDNVINSGGVKVLPEKIEKELATIFLRNNFHHLFFIAALPDERFGSKVVLVLEGVQFSSEILKRSLADLKSVISPYEFPKAVYSTAEFIITSTRKVQRSQTLAKATPVLSTI